MMQRYFLLVDLARIFFLTFNIVLLHSYPITQSILNFVVLVLYDYNLIRYSLIVFLFIFYMSLNA